MEWYRLQPRRKRNLWCTSKKKLREMVKTSISMTTTAKISQLARPNVQRESSSRLQKEKIVSNLPSRPISTKWSWTTPSSRWRVLVMVMNSKPSSPGSGRSRPPQTFASPSLTRTSRHRSVSTSSGSTAIAHMTLAIILGYFRTTLCATRPQG